jgi:hypothetical protein
MFHGWLMSMSRQQRATIFGGAFREPFAPHIERRWR